MSGSHSLEQGDSCVFIWWWTLLRAHFLRRTGLGSFLMGGGEGLFQKKERAAAVLGNWSHSALGGFSLIRTRCANVSGPLHLATGWPSPEGGMWPQEGSSASWMPVIPRWRLEEGALWPGVHWPLSPFLPLHIWRRYIHNLKISTEDNRKLFKVIVLDVMNVI